MAIRRMLSKNICETDKFLAMPISSQCLYFHYNLCADDDGFVSNPNIIKKLVNASEDDYNMLIFKNYIIPFSTGIVVITDWNEHNKIRKDRYKETKYLNEKSMLIRNAQNQYILTTSQSNSNHVLTSCQPNDNQMTTKCQPNDNQCVSQDRIGKDRIGKGDDDVRIVIHNYEVETILDIEKYQIEVYDYVERYYEAYRNDEKVKEELMNNIKLFVNVTNGYSEHNVEIINNSFSRDDYHKVYNKIECALAKSEHGDIYDKNAFVSCCLKKLIKKYEL